MREMREGKEISRWSGVTRGEERRRRTNALVEGRCGEPVGPRQGANHKRGGYARVIHHPRRREACANTHHHTTPPHSPCWWKGIGVGRRRWKATHAERSGSPSVAIPRPSIPTPARLILSRVLAYDWRRGKMIGVLRDALGL